MTMRPPVLVTAPAALPVTLADAKQHLRVDFDDDDTLITGYIEAATGYLDGYSGILGRCLINQEWRQDFDGFCRFLRLPFPNVSAVTVKYDDTDGVEQTVDPADYRVLTDAIGPYLASVPSSYWPTTSGDASVRVTFTAGYGAAETGVPAAIRAAINLMVGDLYQNRETVADKGAGMIEMSMTVDRLLTPHRRTSV